jgi:hypothetical protein
MYITLGNKVLFDHRTNEIDIRAKCATDEDARKAVDMLNKAGYLNDVKRKYTAAARLIAEVENIDGFSWVD